MPNFNTLSPPPQELRPHIEETIMRNHRGNFSSYIWGLVEADMLAEGSAPTSEPDPAGVAYLAQTYYWYKRRRDKGATTTAENWLNATAEHDDARRAGLTRHQVVDEVHHMYDTEAEDTYAATPEAQAIRKQQAEDAQVLAARRAIPSKVGQFGPTDRPMVPATPPVRKGEV